MCFAYQLCMKLKLFIAGIFFLAIVVAFAVDIANRPVFARTADFHVIVDAGHGGRDGGAVSPSGTREAEINLAISRFLAKELGARGIGVTMTRTTDDSLANPLARNRKRSDMDARRRIIERVSPDLVISIHLNSLPSHPGVRGLQTFFCRGSDKSRIFAQAIQTRFNESSLNINRRAMTSDLFMLNATQYPSVLIECGFLSNPMDERLLRTREYQQILARYIAEAVDKIRKSLVLL